MSGLRRAFFSMCYDRHEVSALRFPLSMGLLQIVKGNAKQERFLKYQPYSWRAVLKRAKIFSPAIVGLVSPLLKELPYLNLRPRLRSEIVLMRLANDVDPPNQIMQGWGDFAKY